MIRIHSFESMGTFDGPGLRLVVFLQGCNYRCIYCANPDTITLTGGKLVEEEEILRRAISEKGFFGKKGGITFSGGESTLQAKALIPLFKKLKEENIHICLDTNGASLTNYVKELLSLTDLVLLDVKGINPERHKILTGQSNDVTLKMAAYLEENKTLMRIRYVLIPGYTDYEEDLIAFGEHFKDYQMIDRIELLPYHTYGVHKYESLNMPYLLKDLEENTQENIDRCHKIFLRYFKNIWVQ